MKERGNGSILALNTNTTLRDVNTKFFNSSLSFRAELIVFTVSTRSYYLDFDSSFYKLFKLLTYCSYIVCLDLMQYKHSNLDI